MEEETDRQGREMEAEREIEGQKGVKERNEETDREVVFRQRCEKKKNEVKMK